MKVIKFVQYNEAESLPESGFGGMGGWFEMGMRWCDYKEMWIEDVHETIENLRAAIIENHIKCTGDQHQHSGVESCPVFEDGTTATYSFRAWGDLMAAVWSTEDNEDYSYMSFYM